MYYENVKEIIEINQKVLLGLKFFNGSCQFKYV